jgi:hypothetical protein
MAAPSAKLTVEKTDEAPASAIADTPSESELEDTGLINEKSLLRKLDARLLPAVGILYLLSFLDRSNGMLE